MLQLFGAFYKQWGAFQKSLEKMGKKIDEAQNEFNFLNSTRRKQLERPLNQIEDLRKEKGIIPEASLSGRDTALEGELKEAENSNLLPNSQSHDDD